MASSIWSFGHRRHLSVILLVTAISAYIPNQMREAVPKTVNGSLVTIANRRMEIANEPIDHGQFTKSLPRTTTGHFNGQRISRERASSILTPIDDFDYCGYQFQESEKMIEQRIFCAGPGYSDNRYTNQYPNAGYGYGPGYGGGYGWGYGVGNGGGYGLGYGPNGAGNGLGQYTSQYSQPWYRPLNRSNKHKYFGENLREKVELQCNFWCSHQNFHPNCRLAPINSLYKG